jgi:transcriptional regulator with XRE-family HTH domain
MLPVHEVPAARAALARRLKQLRSNQWPDVRVNQAQLAQAFGVSVPSISSWESERSARIPQQETLEQYATFFATRRSVAATPRLIDLGELTEAERATRERLQRDLQTLRIAAAGDAASPSGFWQMPDGEQIRLVCGTLPDEHAPPYRSASNPNYVKLASFADLDAMVELFGHIRAVNPASDVRYRLASALIADDLVGHVVVVGRAAVNSATRWFSEQLGLPVVHADDPQVPDGEIFRLRDDETTRYAPVLDPSLGLTEDVGLLARVPNPNNGATTVTICSGGYTRGVLGAVRCLTDSRMGPLNESFLAGRFHGLQSYGLLMRVPVLGTMAAPPDLQNPENRLNVWPARLEAG